MRIWFTLMRLSIWTEDCWVLARAIAKARPVDFRMLPERFLAVCGTAMAPICFARNECLLFSLDISTFQIFISSNGLPSGSCITARVGRQAFVRWRRKKTAQQGEQNPPFPLFTSPRKQLRRLLSISMWRTHNVLLRKRRVGREKKTFYRYLVVHQIITQVPKFSV